STDAPTHAPDTGRASSSATANTRCVGNRACQTSAPRIPVAPIRRPARPTREQSPRPAIGFFSLAIPPPQPSAVFTFAVMNRLSTTASVGFVISSISPCVILQQLLHVPKGRSLRSRLLHLPPH